MNMKMEMEFLTEHKGTDDSMYAGARIWAETWAEARDLCAVQGLTLVGVVG